MRRELGFSGSGAQWVLTGYALAFGGLLLICGRAGDLYGRRLLFLAGLAAFGVASLLGGLAPAPWALVVARLFQGAGAAAFVPASLSLLTTIFPEGERRNRAVGVYGAMAALGFAAGVVGGGAVTQLLGWRWVMFVNVPVALAVLAVAPAVIPESKDDGAPRTLDLPGALTAVSASASLVLAVSAAPEQGWASASTLGWGALAALLAAAFVAIEKRSLAPLVPPGLLALPAAAVPNAAIFLQSAIGLSWLYVLTLHFQEVLGRGPLAAGLLFLPMTFSSVVAACAAGRVATRFGPAATSASGLAVVAAGLVPMTAISGKGNLLLVLLGMVVAEAGFVLSNVSLTIAGSGAADEGQRGLAAGLLNTSIQLGGACGLGVVAALIAATGTAGSEAAGELVLGLRAGLAACAGFAVLALAVVLLGMPREKPPKP